MTKQSEITLDDLTSALKAIYGRETEAVLLIFLHWEKTTMTLLTRHLKYFKKLRRAIWKSITRPRH